MTAQQRQFPVSLLVMTWNEAHNIGRCLDSVPFVAEKLVIDSGSTDDTIAVARAHGARVVEQAWLGFGPQRIFATAQSTYEWILFLDADESLSPELAAEFETRLPELLASRLAGAELRRSAWYMGAPMRWYRPMVGERIGRFYHRDRARWTDARVHEALRFDGRVPCLRGVILHHHSATLVHKQLKVLKYSELKALDWADRGRRARLWECPFVYLAAFVKDYFLRLAFLDGGRGFVVAHISAAYAVYKRVRLYEMTVNPGSRDSAQQVMLRHGLWR
jgi:glycosyltransferase involved in cell wall biosynthesis